MNNGDVRSFVANLEAERVAFQEFVELLKSEEKALLQGDIDRLAALAQVKSDKLITLGQLAQQRNSHLLSQSLAADPSGMAQWLEANAAASSTAREAWKRLLELAKAAQQLNQSNGTMIQQRLVNNQKALAVLQATANHASLYGPDGQTRTSNTGRPLGKV